MEFDVGLSMCVNTPSILPLDAFPDWTRKSGRRIAYGDVDLACRRDDRMKVYVRAFSARYFARAFSVACFEHLFPIVAIISQRRSG